MHRRWPESLVIRTSCVVRVPPRWIGVAVMVQSMSAYRAHEDTFGEPPLGVSEERFVETWVELCLAYAVSRGIDVNAGK